MNNFNFTTSATNLTITSPKDKNALTTLTIPDYVTNLGTYAFSDCPNLTTVSIPGSVTTISTSAFHGCTALTSLTLAEGIEYINNSAFYNCNKLTSLIIPNSVKSIGESAFEKCAGLTDLIIGNHVTSIGRDAFNDARSLVNINLPISAKAIGYDAFYMPHYSSAINLYFDGNISDFLKIKINDSMNFNVNYHNINLYLKDSNGEYSYNGKNYVMPSELTIPNTVKSLVYAFNNMPQFETVYLSKGFDIISASFEGDNISTVYFDGTITDWCNIRLRGSFIFENCQDFYVKNNNDEYYKPTDILVEMTKDEKVLTSCFMDLKQITKVTIADDITEIGYSFARCTSLETVIIGQGVTVLDGSFAGCTSLTTITFNNTNKISLRASTFSECTSLQTIDISSCSIYYNATSLFDGCTSLTSVTFSNSYGDVRITENMFNNCSSLQSISLNEFYDGIGNYAFNGCTALSSFNVENIYSFGEGAFKGCTSLTSFNLKQSSEIGNSAFEGCTSLTSISYGGTIADWGSVSKGGDWKKDVPATVVHCIDGNANI